MLNIYARSFMTATRTETAKFNEAAPKPARSKRSWLPEGHWWQRSSRRVEFDER